MGWVKAMRRFSRLIKNDHGATAVEYGLILALVFLALVAGVQAFAGATIGMWTNVSNEVEKAR
jgi:pilus assembly protein Flp/PilA